ncbi:MAG: PKD domain-containing protein [Bacteroidetes bacterium]|nr:PKD domain-containing protein [Bacteroidota bacterium]
MNRYIKTLVLLFGTALAIAAPRTASAQCQFTYDGALCEGNPIRFFGSPAGTTHSWDFGGQGSSSQQITTFVFNSPGTYTVKYQTNIGGNPCQSSLSLQIKPRPTINLKLVNQKTQCFEGNQFCFVDSSKAVPGSTLKEMRIVVSDGQLLVYKYTTQPPRTFCFDFKDDRGGVVDLTVELEDANGCIRRDTFKAVGLVRAKLGIRFTSTKPIKCDSAQACFDNRSNIQLQDIKKFVWNFGDGTKDSTNWGIPRFCKWFKGEGTYTTTLTVESKFGCKETFTFTAAAQVFEARATIIADKDSTCITDPKITFGVKGGAPNGATGFLWNFGDPPSGPRNTDDKTWTPEHNFTGLGPYRIKLTFNHPVCGPRTSYDTILILGPSSTIEIPFGRIKEEEKYQCISRDTVHFPNNSSFYHNDKKMVNDDSTFYIKGWGLGHNFSPKPGGQTSVKASPQVRNRDNVVRLWDFGDNYAPRCTTDTKAKKNVGKNCRWSRDSLPQHFYTPWETILRDTFIKQNRPMRKSLFVDVDRRCTTVNIFWTPKDSAEYRKIFYRTVPQCFQVKLFHQDTAHPFKCTSENTEQIAIMPPSARRLKKSANTIECLGSLNPMYGVTFEIEDTKPGCTPGFFMINLDSASGRNNWVGTGGIPMGNRPPGMPHPGYQMGGAYPNKYSTYYTASMIADPSGCVTVGLVIGNGFKPGPAPRQKPECVDTVWYNKFLCFPLLDPRFDVLYPNKNPLKICKNDTIIVRTIGGNKTKTDDLADQTYSLYTGNAGRNYDQYYRLNLTEEYKRYVYLAGSNKKKLANYLIRYYQKTPASGVPVTLWRDTTLTSVISKWDTAADITKAWDLFKRAVDRLGFDIYELTPTQLAKMIWNNKGTLGQPATGSRGCIDTAGFGGLVRYYVVPDKSSQQILNYRDTSIRPMNTHKAGGKTFANSVQFVPEHNGYYILELLQRSNNGCFERSSKRVVVGFYSKVAYSDTILCAGTKTLTAEPTFRYFSLIPEFEGLLNPIDYWRDAKRQADIVNNVPNRERITRWDWAKEDDDKSNSNTIFGNFPYGATGVGNPSIQMGGGATSSKYYKDYGLFTSRVTTGDSTGCRDTLSQAIYVTGVEAKFGLNLSVPSCKGIVEFFDSSQVFDPCKMRLGRSCDRIVEWYINWGDGKRNNKYSVFSGGYPSRVAHDYTRNGEFTVTLKVKTELGCEDSFELKIKIPGPIPVFEFKSSNRICVNDSVNFRNISVKPSPNANWLWRFGDGEVFTTTTPVDVVHKYKKPGIYYVFLDQFDSLVVPPSIRRYCPATYPDTTEGAQPFMIVEVLPRRDVLGEVEKQTICIGELNTFIDKSDTIYNSYLWTFVNTDTKQTDTITTGNDTLRRSFSTKGKYLAILRPNFRPTSPFPWCSKPDDTLQFTVLGVSADFTIDSSNIPTFCFDRTPSVDATKYRWGFYHDSDITQTGGPFVENNNRPDQVVCNQYDSVGCWYVCLIVENNNGCKDTVCKLVCNTFFSKIEIPNVFTPNKTKDGVNDVFDIPIKGHEMYDLKIFNRWGQRMFASEDHKIDWNGRVNNTGAEAPEGTYYYVLRYRFKNQEKEKEVSGVITLIR